MNFMMLAVIHNNIMHILGNPIWTIYPSFNSWKSNLGANPVVWLDTNNGRTHQPNHPTTQPQKLNISIPEPKMNI